MSNEVLVCDDEQEILEIVKLILEDEGYEVLAVSNSLDVESMREHKRPELVVIDLWMLALSGDQVVAVLREIENLKKISVIVISATSDGRQIAFAAGANEFIAKPFDIDNMITTVKRFMK
jgi:CheY-like chemotaxis protein